MIKRLKSIYIQVVIINLVFILFINCGGVIFLEFQVKAYGVFAGGAGTPEDPYKVSTPEQLNEVRNNLNKSFIQINDIDMAAATQNGDGWLPIGNKSVNFMGKYDGGGYKIISLRIDRCQSFNDTLYCGLFSYIGINGIITNLSMESSMMNFDYSYYTDNTNSQTSYYSSINIGSIAGYNFGKISNCYNTGSVFSSSQSSSLSSYASPYSGGIAGFNAGAIDNCYNTGGVEASSTSYYTYSGGISGYSSGTIINCHNTGNISSSCSPSSGAYSYCGGIVAKNGGSIIRCYNTGSISASNENTYLSTYSYAGGIAGGGTGEISNCYNVGNVSAISKSFSQDFYTSSNSCAGGIIGNNDRTYTGGGGYIDGKMINCYNTGGVSVSATSKSSTARSYAGGIAGGTEGRATNCYWSIDAMQEKNGMSILGSAKKGFGEGIDNTISKTIEQMKGNEFLLSLNKDKVWYTDCQKNNGGMPVLFFSNPSPTSPPSMRFDNAKIVISESGSVYYMYTNGTVEGQSDWRMIVDIAAGGDHVVALRADGTLESKGDNVNKQCDVGSWRNIVAVTAGTYHTSALRKDGVVVSTKPQISNYYGQSDTESWTNIVEVSAGSYHTVGLRKDGTVVAVGDNSFGQCNVSNWTDIVKISSGSTFTIGLKQDGTVVATGNNLRGQCNVTSWNQVIDIYAQSSRTIAVLLDGSVVVAGVANDFAPSKIKEIRCSSGYVDSALFLDKTNKIAGTNISLERGTMVINNYYSGTYGINLGINLAVVDKSYKILYSRDGRDPLYYGFYYNGPFTISDNTKLRIVTVKNSVFYEVEYNYVFQSVDPNTDLLEILEVKNQDGEIITEMNFRSTSTLILEINNRFGLSFADINVAFYDNDGRLCEITVACYVAMSKGNCTIPIILSQSIPENVKNMKIFIWGKGIKPYANWSL